MSHFITSELPGNAAEQTVWDAVRSAFRGRKCLAYWRFPIFSKTGERRKEPDILIADAELGLIVIEVKGIHLGQLRQINGHTWHFQDFYQARGNPYQQAENQLFALLAYCDREPVLRRKVTGRVIVALPFIHSDDWAQSGFADNPAAPPILFEDNLTRASLRNTVMDTPDVVPGRPLSEGAFEVLQATISGTQVYKREPEVETQVAVGSEMNRRQRLDELRGHISRFDIQQETIAKQIPPGTQRIRGVAGSGKTIVLAQKAAQMHLKHPDWDIALVFFTRSLYDVMIGNIDRWIKRFSSGELGYDPANSRLKVLHAWGGTRTPGFYSTVCAAHGVKPLTVRDVPRGLPPTESYAFVLAKLLEGLPEIKPLFDAILVDEGQDLVSAKYLVDGKQPFYWLAYEALRPAAQPRLFTEIDETDEDPNRRLIWAYDEAQSLDTLTIPSYKAIFGEDLSRKLLAGSLAYRGGINKNEVMSRCYRTPMPILTAAHAIGMGLLRPKGMVSGLTTQDDWRNLGYEVEGDFRKEGNFITVRRTAHSHLHMLDSSDLLRFVTHNSRQQELEALVANIKRDIGEDVKASREILVVVVGHPSEAKGLQQSVAEHLHAHSIDYYLPSAPKANTLDLSDWRKQKPDQFWHEGAVTISRIHQAKGNEADVVYLIGFDSVAEREHLPEYRNQVFVALTRTRAWVQVSGVGDYPFFNEFHQVMAAKGEYTFRFKRPDRTLGE